MRFWLPALIAIAVAPAAAHHPFTPYYDVSKPVSMSGVIADYHVHCHIVLCDRRGAFGGHLERGCRVLSLAEIALMRLDGVKLARRLDPTTGQTLLHAVRGYASPNGQRDREISLHAVARRLARTGRKARGLRSS